MAATYKQDMAPKGGYPEINYVRNLPKRGPPGWAIMLGGVAVMSAGFLVVAKANQRRRYVVVSWLKYSRSMTSLFVHICSCLSINYNIRKIVRCVALNFALHPTKEVNVESLPVILHKLMMTPGACD